MAVFRPFLAHCLALVIAVTSGAMAVARGQTNAAGSMVLCAGGTSVTVQVDADGQPIGPIHICPDCALGLFDTGAAEPPTIVLPLTATPAAPAVTPKTEIPFLLFQTPRARAPPVA